ncbi:uncharacterized protein HLK63_D06061 [Nakaseomyces glabratus]|nr:uncharacterized protein GW608_D06061 [Nakaseomyces glabratus]UCS24876.1 uncharacterized protein HLK63_D06061 [Nakaseomyces glabratus]UCS30106.1 uncharacterized protein HLK64_D06061 [Nakaseomyces glabratus]UCS35334.1 uncharacterized protein HLK62_D06061 [Nakaseomyces glabratus]
MNIFVLIWFIGWTCAVGRNGRGQDEHDDFPFTTAVDILSQNVEFSTFLTLIQKGGYIPYLNELDNFTLWAPVNSAFVEDEQELLMGTFDIDNYIIRDCMVITSDIGNSTQFLSENVKFPFFLSRRSPESAYVNGIEIIEPDLLPNVQNATVQGISSLINNPPGFAELIDREHRKDLGIFKTLTNNLYATLESMIQNRTILMIEDMAFDDAFNEIELNYLLDRFNSTNSIGEDISRTWKEDSLRLMQAMILREMVAGSLEEEAISFDLNNKMIRVDSISNGNQVKINDTIESTKGNLLYNRGVSHIFRDFSGLNSTVEFNAEKYLHGLNKSEFVKELYFRKLQNMITSDENLTIFVSEDGNDDVTGYTKPSLLYHFAEEKIWIEREITSEGSQSSKLYDSAFCSSNKRLGGHCQKFKITKKGDDYFINDRYKITSIAPMVIKNTLIYTISDNLQLPGDLVSAIPPLYHCYKSLRFLNELNLLDLEANHNGYTIFLPCFQSWDIMELNLEYLSGNKTALNELMRNLIIDGLHYTNNDTTEFTAHNKFGDEVTVDFSKSDTSEGVINVKMDSMDGILKIESLHDVFFNQGVIHPIDQIIFPHSLNISLNDLMKSDDCSVFKLLLKSINQIGEILNNDDEYSILVPTSSSIISDGLSVNTTNLEKILKIHIIPGNYTQSLLDCNSVSKSLSGDSIYCRKASQTSRLLSFMDGQDKEVRILKMGCSSSKSNSCIFLIDKPISPDWLKIPRTRLDLPGVAVGIGVLLGSLFVVLLLGFIILMRMNSRADRLLANTPTSESSSPDDTERNPLLQQNAAHGDQYNSISATNAGNNASQNSQSFEASYSANAQRLPIKQQRSTNNTIANARFS